MASVVPLHRSILQSNCADGPFASPISISYCWNSSGHSYRCFASPPLPNDSLALAAGYSKSQGGGRSRMRTIWCCVARWRANTAEATLSRQRQRCDGQVQYTWLSSLFAPFFGRSWYSVYRLAAQVSLAAFTDGSPSLTRTAEIACSGALMAVVIIFGLVRAQLSL